MEAYLFILALLALGVVLRFASAPADFAKSLNFFVIYVSLPATVAIQAPKIALDYSALSVAIIPWLLLPLSVLLVLWMTQDQPKSVRAALLLVVPLGNTSFVGIPMVSSLLGEQAIPYVLIYDQFGTFLMLSLYGSIVIARYESGAIRMRVIGRKLITFPPLVVLILSLGFGKVDASITPYVQTLASTLVPLALISVGFSLQFGGEMDWKIFTQSLGIKLVLMPLLAWGILSAMGADMLALQTAVLESGMPSMITAGALAIAAGFAPSLSAALVGYGIFVSMVTLPLWMIILG